MKELSIEEKAKAYDELKVKAQELTEDGYIDKLALLDLFPELAESGDERIRKWIIENIQETLDVDGFFEGQKTMAKEAIAWLEKQGKQKPAIEMKTPEESLGIDSDTYNKIVDECIYGEQKPADEIEPIFNVGDKIQYSKGCSTIFTIEKIENGEYLFANNMGHTTIEWGNKWYLVEQKPVGSEEDESRMDNLCHFLEEYENQYYGHLTLQGTISWLKSLRPQNHWKPSDEQMDALNDVISSRDIKYDVLSELWKDLKKLREE